MPMFMLNGKQYGGNGGNYQVAKMSKAEYDALTDAQKNDGTLRIVVDSAGNSVNYMSAQVAGAKTDDTLTNLVPNGGLESTGIPSGVTITDNGDGTYTLNGTSTSSGFIVVYRGQNSHNKVVEDNKEYLLTNCQELPLGLTLHIGMRRANNSTVKDVYVPEGTESIVFDTNDVSAEWENSIIFYNISSGKPFDNVVLKPMITSDLLAKGDDFVGYTGGTGRLNSDVAEHEKEISRINSELTELLKKLP
jgi:hypothetical protein